MGRSRDRGPRAARRTRKGSSGKSQPGKTKPWRMPPRARRRSTNDQLPDGSQTAHEQWGLRKRPQELRDTQKKDQPHRGHARGGALRPGGPLLLPQPRGSAHQLRPHHQRLQRGHELQRQIRPGSRRPAETGHDQSQGGQPSGGGGLLQHSADSIPHGRQPPPDRILLGRILLPEGRVPEGGGPLSDRGAGLPGHQVRARGIGGGWPRPWSNSATTTRPSR